MTGTTRPNTRNGIGARPWHGRSSCGEDRPAGVYRFTRAKRHIGGVPFVPTDFVHANEVLRDLSVLIRRRHTLRRYIVRTFKLLLANWPAVKAVAAALIRDGRIDGAEIERIVDGSSQ